MSKPNLMLVPGLMCTEILWRDQIAAFGDDCTIIVPQHHLDDRLEAIGERILADAPDRFSVAGLSMGGYIAMELWRQAPERIERIALLDTRCTMDNNEERARREDFLKLVDKGHFKGISAQLLPRFIHPDRMGDRDLTDAIHGMAAVTGAAGFVNQTRAVMARQDMSDLLKTVSVPALVLCGRQDILTPLDMSEYMASLIPGARLEIIENCGHLATMEQPVAVNAAMRRWLAV